MFYFITLNRNLRYAPELELKEKRRERKRKFYNFLSKMCSLVLGEKIKN